VPIVYRIEITAIPTHSHSPDGATSDAAVAKLH